MRKKDFNNIDLEPDKQTSVKEPMDSSSEDLNKTFDKKLKRISNEVQRLTKRVNKIEEEKNQIPESPFKMFLAHPLLFITFSFLGFIIACISLRYVIMDVRDRAKETIKETREYCDTRISDVLKIVDITNKESK